MTMSFSDTFLFFTKNENQGVLTIIIFLATLIFGWVSGIFSSLRRRPKFRIGITPGPTFCCTYNTGQKYKTFDVHRTGVALYLNIANVGSAPSGIEEISVGYHWFLKPFSIAWMKNTLGWYWLDQQTVALEDFQVVIGGKVKFFPFLLQRSVISGSNAETYLDVGNKTYGVVYFEQDDSWGGCFPSVYNGFVRIKVKIRDVFGRNHCGTFQIPALSIDEARKYNPSFGKTLVELRGQELPFDALNNAYSNADVQQLDEPIVKR